MSGVFFLGGSVSNVIIMRSLNARKSSLGTRSPRDVVDHPSSSRLLTPCCHSTRPPSLLMASSPRRSASSNSATPSCRHATPSCRHAMPSCGPCWSVPLTETWQRTRRRRAFPSAAAFWARWSARRPSTRPRLRPRPQVRTARRRATGIRAISGKKSTKCTLVGIRSQFMVATAPAATVTAVAAQPPRASGTRATTGDPTQQIRAIS